MPNRPSRRTLVRWNDDHDKELLLWICYCCTEAGIKIPFARVAQCMGASFTEGACIQHLAKIRNKMEEAGLHVPPTQKRGTVTKTGSSIYRPRLKEIDAPVPRVRPDIPPPVRSFSLYDDNDDEEEEEEHVEHQETNATSKADRPSKAARRQARTNKASAIKHDPSEDDELLPVHDSDGEYSATKPISSFPSTQMKLQFTKQSKPMLANPDQGKASIDSIQPIPKSPTIKYETIEDYNSASIAQMNPPQSRNNRRKGGVTTGEDDDDDEYEPGNKGKSRSKKKTTRAAKKQKLDDKKKGATDKTADPLMSNSYAALNTQNADRAAMPPPSLPVHNTNFDFGWNPDFINQPFSSVADHHNLTYRGMDDGTSHSSTWNDPTTNGFDNFDFTQGAGIHDPIFNPYSAVPFQHHFGSMNASTSAPPTRNASYASAASNSTVESQPASWNQPTRSPGFPNPQEATRVLHKMLNTPDADASTHINIFSDKTLQNRSLGSGFGHDTFKQARDHQNQTAFNMNGPMFVGTPELPEMDINFSDFLHD